MAKKAGQHIDTDEMAALFPTAAPEEQPKTAPPYDQVYERRTYRLRPATHESLKEIAQTLGVGLNELVRFVLDDFCQRYAAGDVQVVVGTRTLHTPQIQRLDIGAGD
ncbi:MAG: hypothetical protein KKA73_00640 [Chloroflexi bacterium]|nr:hypothetical protein [Chloroflexota bacterium]MBU1746169.1 hypothetical protein [Chloroflexota bacterium]